MLFSLAIVIGPVAVPEYIDGLGSGVLGAKGNESTCKAQGFFKQLGLTAALYNTSLCIYYLLLIVYNWSNTRINKIKVWLLGPPAVIGVVLAAVAIPYYKLQLTACDMDASRKWKPAIAFTIIPICVMLFVTTAIMVKIYLHVRKGERRANRWRCAGHSTGSFQQKALSMTQNTRSTSNVSSSLVNPESANESSNGRSSSFSIARLRRQSSSFFENTTSEKEKEVFWQSLLFLMGFYLTWPIFISFHFLDFLESTRRYALSVCILLFCPLQGVHNFLVYTRGRRKRARQARRLKKTAKRREKNRVSQLSTQKIEKHEKTNSAAVEEDLPIHTASNPHERSLIEEQSGSVDANEFFENEWNNQIDAVEASVTAQETVHRGDESH